MNRVFASDAAARRAGNFFAAVAGCDWGVKANDLPIVKAAAEGVNSLGGFLVPDELANSVIALRDVRGIFRNAVGGVQPMKSDSDTIPRRTSGLTAYFVAEGAALTESQASWDNVAVVAKKLATLTRTSSELQEDSAGLLGEQLTSEIAYALADAEDRIGFNGDGSQTDGGVRGITVLLKDGSHNAGKIAAAAGHDTFAEIDATVDLASLVAALPSYAVPGAKFYCSPLAFGFVFCRLAAGNAGIIMMEKNGRTVPTFWGFEIVISSTLPNVATTLNGSIMLLFGDLSLSSTLGERRGISIAQSTQRYADLDQILWKGTERIDIVNHDCGSNSVAGPVVGLLGN
jgi:HK97 family phage major capsid protein